MLKRKIENRIESWKATKTNQGLLITGARQTGKTSSIEAFGRERYEAMVKIDFVEQPRAVEVISEAQNLSDLIMRITALAERPLVPESTLLFFDEVQRCADAITWMRYLAEETVSTSSTLARCSASRPTTFDPCPSEPSTSRKCSRSTSKSSAGPREPTQCSGMP